MRRLSFIALRRGFRTLPFERIHAIFAAFFCHNFFTPRYYFIR
jgi:hypothetical protein